MSTISVSHKSSTSEEKIISSVNAKVELQNRILEDTTRILKDLSQELKITNSNLKILSDFTKTSIDSVNERISQEAKRTREVTRLWSSFGFGIVFALGKLFLSKFGIYFDKLLP